VLCRAHILTKLYFPATTTFCQKTTTLSLRSPSLTALSIFSPVQNGMFNLCSVECKNISNNNSSNGRTFQTRYSGFLTILVQFLITTQAPITLATLRCLRLSDVTSSTSMRTAMWRSKRPQTPTCLAVSITALTIALLRRKDRA
jgi:hypothetical protein